MLSDGNVSHVVWTVPACSNPAHAREWAAPTDATTQQFTLSRGELDQLQRFLDGPAVKSMDAFRNAGPGVGDYYIEIHRPGKVQTVGVISLMPSHFQLQRDPSLLRVICKAKKIAGDKRPEWCANDPAPQTPATRAR